MNKKAKKDWMQEMITYESTPKSLRVPQDKGKFIESLGIPKSNYYYELSKKENKKRIVEIWLSEALNGGNEILEKLGEKARGGDMKAIELYMKFVLELAENLDIKSDGKAIALQLINSIADKHAIDNDSSKSDS